MAVGISLRDFAPLYEKAWTLALAHERSVYDAAYLALAEQCGCEFYTGDKRFARAASGTGLVKWVGEFRH
jgi:predicted nucleic acid-binding protein